MRRIDHIGIAVSSLDDAIKVYRDVLGLELVEVEEVPEEKVKVAMFKAGDSYIELLEPLSEDSAIAKYLQKRGEGIHHIAIGVEDVEKLTEELKERGVRVIYDKPKVVSGGTRKINFIHPKATHGVLLEIVERLKK